MTECERKDRALADSDAKRVIGTVLAGPKRRSTGTSAMTDGVREDWALADRDAKILISVMLALQVMFLLGTLLWV